MISLPLASIAHATVALLSPLLSFVGSFPPPVLRIPVAPRVASTDATVEGTPAAGVIDRDAPLPIQMSDEPAVRIVPPAIVRRVDVGKADVAITFDACATRTHANGFDRPVYEVLKSEGVPATIFVSGRWVETHPEVMNELAANSLIELANHSYAHPRMARLRQQDIELEIDRTEALLSRYGKKSVAFRPPYGEFNDLVLSVARDRQLPAVLWDVVSGDPSARMTAPTMIKSVVQKTRPGSIIIFHINGVERKTAVALPIILRDLRERGFRFVHLSELLAAQPGELRAAAFDRSADTQARLEEASTKVGSATESVGQQERCAQGTCPQQEP